MNRKNIFQWFLIILLTFALEAVAFGVKIGQVTRLTGRADVTRNQRPAQLLRLGDIIHEKDILRTKTNSLLEITTNDKGRLTLSENSRMAIAKFVTRGQPKGLLEMTRGKLRAFVTDVFSKHSESFQVRTPTAVAGVMGTDFGVVLQPRETRVFLFKGILVVFNVNPKIPGRQVLHKNQQSTIKEGEPPTPPVDILLMVQEFLQEQSEAKTENNERDITNPIGISSPEEEQLTPPTKLPEPVFEGKTIAPPEEPVPPPEQPVPPPEEPVPPPEQPVPPPEEPVPPPEQPVPPPEEPVPPPEQPTPPPEEPVPPEQPTPPPDKITPPPSVPPGPPDGHPAPPHTPPGPPVDPPGKDHPKDQPPKGPKDQPPGPPVNPPGRNK